MNFQKQCLQYYCFSVLLDLWSWSMWLQSGSCIAFRVSRQLFLPGVSLKVALATNRPLLCQFCVTGTLTALGQTTGIVPGEHAWCNSLIPLSGTHVCDTRSVTPGKLTITHARTHTHTHTRTRTWYARARWQTRTRKAKEPCLATIRVNFTRAISASPPQK